MCEAVEHHQFFLRSFNRREPARNAVQRFMQITRDIRQDHRIAFRRLSGRFVNDFYRGTDNNAFDRFSGDRLRSRCWLAACCFAAEADNNDPTVAL